MRQPHGGAIKRGGNRGNKGGGRPPDKIRESARLSFAERLTVLEAIADDEDARDSDRIKAVDTLGKYGGVEKLALTPDEQPEQVMTPERAAELVAKVQRLKSIEDKERLFIDAARKQLETAR